MKNHGVCIETFFNPLINFEYDLDYPNEKIVYATSTYNNNNEIMYIDYSTDECIWYFNDNNVITVTEDMELFECLMYL